MSVDSHTKELREKLFASDAFVLAEIERLRVFYVLKQEIRYGLTRNETLDTESVAEHIYGMFMLSRYFLPLEDLEGEWDRRKIDDMMLYHDIDEIETGDTIGYLKTTEHQSVALDATRRVIAQVPESLHEYINTILEEYFVQETPESRFVKAMDKFEPVVHLYCQNGKETLQYQNTTFEQGMGIKRPIMQHFPMLLRFTEVASAEMQRQGFFTEKLPLHSSTDSA